MNWQEQLASFRANNPDLPEGPEIEDEPTPLNTPSKHPRVDVSIERKGRAGKTATLITGWILPDSDLLQIASKIKQRLGAGGSARGGDILIQGDRRKEVVDILKEMGYKARQI
ncbi:MAG: translation initiation factor [Barnesiella sp.]|nr:translation initiation factor [Barnesiella sp.]